MKKIRLIIDTNLWISFLISKRKSIIEEIFLSTEFEVLFSDESIFELIEVVRRPKFKNYFPPEDIVSLWSFIQSHATFIKTTSQLTICRDPKDNFLLNVAVDGNADYLLTGDNDLLSMEVIKKTKIITLAEFKRKINL